MQAGNAGDSEQGWQTKQQETTVNGRRVLLTWQWPEGMCLEEAQERLLCLAKSETLPETKTVLAHEEELPDGRTVHLALEVRTDVTAEEYLRMPPHARRMIDEAIDGADEVQA